MISGKHNRRERYISRMHWFEKRWMVELAIIDGKPLAEIGRKFGRTHAGVAKAVGQLTGFSVEFARKRYWKGLPTPPFDTQK